MWMRLLRHLCPMQSYLSLISIMFPLILGIGTTHAQAPMEPEGYRLEHYRSPTPATLQGAIVVDTLKALRLHEAGAIMVDTTPITRTGFTDMTGLWNVVNERLNIENSLWLPNIGYGRLKEDMVDYFQSQLALATQHNPSHPLIFYCYADCWMSYNAAKRAMEIGYSSVFWYPEGTDGWRAAGFELVEGIPVPLFENE